MDNTVHEMKSAVLDVRPMLRGFEKAVVQSVPAVRARYA